jgi:hypothetical protein
MLVLHYLLFASLLQIFKVRSDTWLSRDGFEHCHRIQVSKLLRFFLDGLAHLWRNSNYVIYNFVWNVGCVHCELITSDMQHNMFLLIKIPASITYCVAKLIFAFCLLFCLILESIDHTVLFPTTYCFVPTRKIFCSHNILPCSHTISPCSLNVLFLRQSSVCPLVHC